MDFNKFAEELVGVSPSQWENDKGVKSSFWKKANTLQKDGKPVFGAMDPMSDAFVLWDYIKKYDPVILSATGHLKAAAHEKREWVRRHLGDDAANRALFVTSANDKSQYATTSSILIDDRKKAIEPWLESGGIAVHHISATDSIEQLKKLKL